MKQTYFLTGYPGFLASNLVEQLLTDHGDDIDHIYLFTLPHLKNHAEAKLTTFIQEEELSLDLFTLVTGDITKSGLKIDRDVNRILQDTVTHVFHLAAIYDLAVPHNQAYKVNVTGTNYVNEWVRSLTNLSRYIYFSTAYVSGTREGRIFENELSTGQSFKNYYEETKYHAEVLVNHLKEEGIPLTIIRPGIVKGNATTGKTIKFDGLYFLLNVLDQLSCLPFVPYFGAGEPEGNFVPDDYILKATSYLAIHPVGVGKTYHLTDPNPYKMSDLQKMLSQYYLGENPKGHLPISILKLSLRLAPIRKWLNTEEEVMDYFLYKACYDSSQTTSDLQGSGIVCPDLKDTLPAMIDFYRKYKDDHNKQLKIK